MVSGDTSKSGSRGTIRRKGLRDPDGAPGKRVVFLALFRAVAERCDGTRRAWAEQQARVEHSGDATLSGAFGGASSNRAALACRPRRRSCTDAARRGEGLPGMDAKMVAQSGGARARPARSSRRLARL